MFAPSLSFHCPFRLFCIKGMFEESPSTLAKQMMKFIALPGHDINFILSIETGKLQVDLHMHHAEDAADAQWTWKSLGIMV